MAKKRERSEVEFLRGRVKALTSEVRSLKRLLGRTEKTVKKFENYIGEEIEAEAEEQIADIRNDDAKAAEGICPECLQAKLEIVELGPRLMHNCKNCRYRKFIKI